MTNFRYRHYIYLDSDEILKVAAIIEGGEVGDELRNLIGGFAGNIGARSGSVALGANLGQNARKRGGRQKC